MRHGLKWGLSLLVSLAISSPLLAGFIDIRVIQSSDDAEETVSSGNMNLTSTDVELVFDGATEQLVGLRFQDVTIPQGATIVSAVLEFETDETDSGSTSVVIRGEDADNAATFSTSNSDISNRTTTTASVAWSSLPAWNTVSELHQSPDITSIVQEIVDRGSWASDNAMVLIIEAGAGCGSSVCQRTAESFDGESDGAPVLRIEFDGVIPEPSTSICYSVADSNNELKEIPTTGVGAGSPTTVGDTEGSSIEALAYQVKHGVLYGADGDQLGRINRNTGQFLALEGTFGTGSATIGGSTTAVDFDDVDGLSFDPTTAVLYGVNASAGADELFAILFRTGAFLEDAFGTGEDFVELSGTGADDIGNQVDDIAFDPSDSGQLYATDGDELYSVDKATGETTLVADFRVGTTTGTDIIDMEGLSFDDMGQLYGTTGTSGPAATRNRLWTISKTTGVATQVGSGSLGSGTDYESVECVFTADLTYASVTDFRALQQSGKTIVEWRTAGEVGTLGFHLSRWSEQDGFVQLHEKLLPGLLTAPQGGVYRFLDGGVDVGGTYIYQLVEVDGSGARRTHGPFHVTVVEDSPSSHELAKLSEEGSRFLRQPHALVATASVPVSRRQTFRKAVTPDVQRRGRVEVDRSGLYFLPAEEIADALGLSLSRIREVLPTKGLELSHNGSSVATFSEPGFDGIFFFGQPLDSVYSKQSIYWLDLLEGVGASMDSLFADGFELGNTSRWSSPQSNQSVSTSESWSSQISTPSFKSTSGFVDRLHFEEDHFPVTSVLGAPEEGFWFWRFILAEDPTFGSAELALRANHVFPAGQAQLAIDLLSVSSGPAVLDHRVTLHLNDQWIGEGTWDGTTRYTLQADFDAGLLHDGDNKVTITGLLAPAVASSIFFVDAMELTYPRRFVAVDGSLLLRADGHSTVEVEGFDSAQLALFGLESPHRPRRLDNFVIDGAAGSYSLRFQPRGRQKSHLVVDLASVAALPVTRFDQQDLHQGSADYLVVAPSQWRAQAERLAEYRGGRGLETKVVTLEQVQANFRHGEAHPEALQDLLRHASTNWLNAPRFVVLLGDGDFDYHDVLGVAENAVPPMLVSTPHGLSGSDVALADFENEDRIPDVAVGRLPARNAVELDRMIDKIIAHESAPGGTWRRHFVFVADNTDVAGDFQAGSSALIGGLPSTVTHEQILLGDLGPEAARDLLLARLDEGAVMVNYMGHGGVDRFADEGLLLRTDAASLTNGDRLPVITALSCLAGRFDLPGYGSLGEELVRAEEGGAIAFWGPTLVSNHRDATTLGQAFHQALFEPGISTLGEAILRAQTELVATSSANRTLPYLYVLLGDPALELP